MIDPADIYTSLVRAGNDWTDKNAAAELLERSEKTVLAELYCQAPEGAATAKEAWARRNEKFIEHIRLSVDARREANKAKVLYDSQKTLVDLRRTEAATERQTNKHAT